MKIACVLVLLCTLLLQTNVFVEGFAPIPPVQNSRRQHYVAHIMRPTSSSPAVLVVPAVPQAAPSLLVLHGSNSAVDGSDRGAFLQVVALVIVLWGFSIPPEFRRAHFCSGNVAGTVIPCAEQRASCYDCVTFDEWKTGIAQYYEDGGGINFDFSIDPKTTAANEQMLNGVLKR